MMSAGDAAFGSQGSYEGISDLLKCYICFDRLKRAMMCPHCSKISCYHCIKKWISIKPECPHCRARLLQSELIEVHSLQDLIDFMTKQPTPSTDTEYCSQHPHLTLTVYCETCSVCICSDCALWGAHRENQGHSIKPLEELYKQQKKGLEKKLSKLQERLKEILSLVEHIEITMDGTKGQRNRTQQEIDKVVEDIFGRLNDQLRTKLQKLTDGKRYLKRQACQITTISTEIEGKIKGSQSLIVSQREELQEKLTATLQELESSKMAELEVKPEVTPFVNEIIPQYETAEFEIKDFSKKQLAGEEIFSTQLTYCGLSWRLKVYPNGTEDFTGRYLGVFVELYDGYSQTAMYNYFVEMVHGAGHYRSSRSRTGNFKRDYASDFAVGEAWGYKKFYEIKNLETKGFLVKDTLLLKFGVRHPTFHQKCRDCLLYINDLKHKIMALKHQNSHLRHKCDGIAEEGDDIAILKMKNKAHKVKSPKDIQEESCDKSSTDKRRKEEKVADDAKREMQQPLEEMEVDRTLENGNHHTKLTKTPISLSQPHLQSVHDSRVHRSEREGPSRRSAGLHPTHSLLVTSPGQRTRHQQQSHYGHCISHRRKSDNPDAPQTILEQRRQSFDPSRMQQLMYDQSQSMMLPQPHPQPHPQMMYPPGSLSQVDYMMMPSHSRGEYFTTIREKPPDQQQLDYAMQSQSQSSPRRHAHQQREEFVETDIMDNLGSQGTFAGDGGGSQLGLHHSYYRQLSQELQESCDLSDILSVNTPVDDSLVSQKMGYGMMEMSQPVDHVSYGGGVRKKSGDSQTLTQMDHMSRSFHNLHGDSHGGFKGDNAHRKPVRTRSTNQHPTHSNIKSMGSEPQLNMYGPPGLVSSMLPRLAAPLEQLRPGSSSTLPHSTRGPGNKYRHTQGGHGTRSQQKHQNPDSVQHSKQTQQGGIMTSQQQVGMAGSQQVGVVPMTQPSPFIGSPEEGSPERRSKQLQDKPQDNKPPSAPTSSSTSTTSSSSTSPVQQRLQQQSPSNQKLRLSGRSYKMSKKCLEGRSSPSKSALSNSYFKQSDKVELTSPDNNNHESSTVANANRLTVGGNITNNTSLSQLDKLL